MTPSMFAARHAHPLGTVAVEAALRGFRECAPEGAIGFGYRPAEAYWFRLDHAGAPVGPGGRPVDVAGTFELRAFTRTHELRWTHRADGTGPAVVVSDAAPHQQPAEYGRLLWGTVVAVADDGWATLSNSRIGTFTVPVADEVDVGARLCLYAVEYVSEDEHGNLAVADERLTRIGHHVQGERDE